MRALDLSELNSVSGGVFDRGRLITSEAEPLPPAPPAPSETAPTGSGN